MFLSCCDKSGVGSSFHLKANGPLSLAGLVMLGLCICILQVLRDIAWDKYCTAPGDLDQIIEAHHRTREIRLFRPMLRACFFVGVGQLRDMRGQWMDGLRVPGSGVWRSRGANSMCSCSQPLSRIFPQTRAVLGMLVCGPWHIVSSPGH